MGGTGRFSLLSSVPSSLPAGSVLLKNGQLSFPGRSSVLGGGGLSRGSMRAGAGSITLSSPAGRDAFLSALRKKTGGGGSFVGGSVRYEGVMWLCVTHSVRHPIIHTLPISYTHIRNTVKTPPPPPPQQKHRSPRFRSSRSGNNLAAMGTSGEGPRPTTLGFDAPPLSGLRMSRSSASLSSMYRLSSSHRREGGILSGSGLETPPVTPMVAGGEGEGRGQLGATAAPPLLGMW